MRIFKSKFIPHKVGSEVYHEDKINYVLELNGEKLYGFLSKEQVEEALKVKEHEPFRKTIYDY